MSFCLGLTIANNLMYLALVLGGAWTLVDIWQNVQDNDEPDGCEEIFKSQKNRCEGMFENCMRPGSPIPPAECQRRRTTCIKSAELDREACRAASR
jgi:hypothetical protein